VVRDAALLVRDGRVERIARGARARAARAARGTLCIDGVVTAGLVNAHAHLELGWAANRMRAGASMPDWIAALLALRAGIGAAALAAAHARATAEGCAELLRTGCTRVGDIQSDARAAAVLARAGLAGIGFLELLDAGRPERTAAQIERARASLNADGHAGLSARARALVRSGLSPHAPYTTSPALLGALGALLRRRARFPLAVHWAEFEAERAWLEHGRGPLAKLLAHPPRASGLDMLASAGLLRAATLLVHANDATRAERERVAASGASVVHCPGSHAWFERPRFDLRAWMRAGVRVVLGTDSLASNTALDMRRELALLRDAHPWLAPEHAWRMATVDGAESLGGGAGAGTLLPRASADWVAFDVRAASAPAVLDALTSARPAVLHVHTAGCDRLSRRGPRLQPAAKMA
jgi:5-methylthioadenosine/S-adenosylhomocysteine deaminase